MGRDQIFCGNIDEHLSSITTVQLITVFREYPITNEVTWQELTGRYIIPWRRILQKLISPHLIKNLAALAYDNSLPRSRTPHYSET